MARLKGALNDMTWLIVTGSILLFFAVILFSPVILRFRYKDGRLDASVRYLILLIDFSPEKLAKRAERKAARAVKKEYKKQEEEEEGGLKAEKAAADTVKTVWSLLKASKKSLNIIRRHLVFYKIRAAVVAGGEDAHKAGTNYAVYCTLIPNLISLLDALFVVREPRISILPDFLLEKTSLDIAFRVRISPWYVLSATLNILIKFLKVINADKKKRKKVKGGKRHEPTASYQ